MIDLVFVCFAFFFAYLLRFNFDLLTIVELPVYGNMAVILFSYSIGFALYRPFKGIVRHTGIYDIQRIIYSNGLGISLGLILYGVSFISPSLNFLLVPISILFIHFFVATFLMASVRFAIKSFYRAITKGYLRPRNVLIYGAGNEGLKTKHVIEQETNLGYKVVGFIDDQRSISGLTLDGLPIYNSNALSKSLIAQLRVQVAVICIQKMSSMKKQKLLNRFLDFDLEIKSVPPVNQWINGEFASNQIEDLKIDDLLGRNPIRLDHKEVKDQIRGRVVMVTGAAGSIGSEISRQVMHYKPSLLILVDKAESDLHDLVTELQHVSQYVDGLKMVPALCDVVNTPRMQELFELYHPEVIYHVAAYKHVPLMENHPYEAIRSNVLGTRNVVQLCMDYEVKDFVLVSTDKAVNPTNVMGASKRLAELYCQYYQRKSETTIITTRFGNVLGSNGSVIPLFKKQIQEGRPLTITHPEVSRYFMTIPEASELVLEAGAMGKGGEIFVFDMGDPVKMVDLAKKMIQICGKSEDEIDINFIGLRPGEKLYEELLSNLEETKETYHSKIRIVKGKTLPHPDIIRRIDELVEMIDTFDDKEIVRRMKTILPEYKSNNSIYEELDDEQAMVS